MFKINKHFHLVAIAISFSSLTLAAENEKDAGFANILAGAAQCRADLDKVCKGAIGDDQVKCLEEQHFEFSKPCQDFLSLMHAIGSGFLTSCKDDIDKYCGGFKKSKIPGPEKVAQEGKQLAACLQKHTSELSPTCREKINSVGTSSQANGNSRK